MALPEEIAEALEELEEEYPATITWSGNDYPCFASNRKRGGTLEAGGWQVSDTLTVTVRESLFEEGAKPLKGHSVINNGLTYRINEVLTASGSFLRLECVSEARGA